MTPEQKRIIAAIRRLLSSPDATHIDQAMELVVSTGDVEVQKLFLEGNALQKGAILPSPELRKQVRAPLRERAALRALAHTGQLTTLRALTLTPDTLPLVGALPALENLTIESAASLQDLSFLARFPSLRFLTLKWAFALSDLSGLTHTPHLQHLSILGALHLHDLTPLQRCPQLRLLKLMGAQNLPHLSPLVGLPTLHTLTLTQAHAVTDHDALGDLSALTTLTLHEVNRLTHLPPPPPPPHTLHLHHHAALTHLRGLPAEAPELHTLSIESSSISDISSLPGWASLYTLNLSACPQLYDWAPLADCTSLRHLTANWTYFARLPSLARLVFLERASFRNCSHLDDLPALAALPSLRTLDLSNSAPLPDLTPLLTNPALTLLR